LEDHLMSDAGFTEQPSGHSGWIATHPKTMIALGLLVVLVVVIIIFNSVAERWLELRIAEVRARGEPTTAEDLQASMPRIPPEENVAILLLAQTKRLAAYKTKIPEEQNALLPLVGAAPRGLTGRRLPPEQLEIARGYLSKCADEIGGIHAAVQFDHGCADLALATPMIGTQLPGLMEYRLAANALALEAAVAAEDADAELAGRTLLDLCRTESALESDPFVISLLVRIGFHGLAEEQIERTVNMCGLSDEYLHRLQGRLAGLEGSLDFKKVMMTERVSFVDTAQWMRAGPGNIGTLMGERFEPPPLWRYLPILPAWDTAIGVEMCNAVVDAVDKPDAATLKRLNAVSDRRNALGSYHFISRMVPTLTRAAALWVRSVGMNRAMQAALACERYRLARENWPESLDALVPEYLAAVPVDPFDGKPIRFQRIPEGIKVWCIGEDAKDDGGDVLRIEDHPSSRKPKDAGWVLLNPDLRGRPSDPKPATSPAGTP
jgi:hypothetical protein